MSGWEVMEEFIAALTQRLQERFDGYTVGDWEPKDGDLQPRQMWVTDDAMSFPDQYADQGMSSAVVLPVYVSSVIDPPWDSASQRLARQHRSRVVRVVAGVIREFSDRLVVILQPEGLRDRQNYIVSYLQLDIQLLDLEAE